MVVEGGDAVLLQACSLQEMVNIVVQGTLASEGRQLVQQHCLVGTALLQTLELGRYPLIRHLLLGRLGQHLSVKKSTLLEKAWSYSGGHWQSDTSSWPRSP